MYTMVAAGVVSKAKSDKMKERILYNWTFSRAIYLVLGLAIMIHGFTYQEWFGVAFGAYFASMGLFAFGCASGNCFTGNCATEPPSANDVKIEDVKFEEIKSK